MIRNLIHGLIIIIISVVATLTIIKFTSKSNISQKSPEIVKALAAESYTVTIDFSNQIATGSPLVFGGVHTPNLSHQDAWDLVNNVGITNIRRDIWIQDELPTNITLEDYKANINNVQNPDSWNQAKISEVNNLYQNAQIRGIKVMAILAYSPKWLTFSGTIFGVPKDWSIFEDIVQKSYRIHRPYIDMIEIWNEPDIQNFLDLTGTKLSRNDAYAQLFEHAVNAINAVNNEVGDGKQIQIIAPGAAVPNNTELIDYLLSKPISKYIDGVSIHSYEKDEPSWIKYLTVMKKYGREKLPIFITEWNQTGKYIKNNKYVSSDLAIPFTGRKLVQYLKFGITGANYFSTTYFDKTSNLSYRNSFGFYTVTNGKSELLPQSKTWQILSRNLALGAGLSKIYQTDQPQEFEAVGFSNSQSKKGLAIVNMTDRYLISRVSLQNTQIQKNSTAKLFIASSTSDSIIPECTQNVSSNSRNQSFLVKIPPNSIIGVIFEPPVISFNTLFSVLGMSTNRDCLEGL